MDVFRRLVDQSSLTTNLGGDLIVGQTSSGEDGNFLSSGDRVHCIYRRYTGCNHFFGIDLERGQHYICSSDFGSHTREYGLIGLPLMSR